MLPYIGIIIAIYATYKVCTVKAKLPELPQRYLKDHEITYYDNKVSEAHEIAWDSRLKWFMIETIGIAIMILT